MAEAMSEREYAKCAVCGQPTRQEVVTLDQPEITGRVYIVPVYHAECVPADKRSGHAGRKSNGRLGSASA